MNNNSTIIKSAGVTDTERLLSQFCEKTFLNLWSYPNPYRDDGKELCDLIVVFEDHIILFFDRKSQKFENKKVGLGITWSRWKREAIDRQIATAKGAERYLKNGRSVYLDSKRSTPFPLKIRDDAKISKFVVAHGAEEACKEFSPENIYGSLAICYGDRTKSLDWPFLVGLDSDDIVHVLDSKNLPILFGNLDTIYDFSAYISEKEKQISKLDILCYCGEEDLIAHYLSNFSEDENRHIIGPHNEKPTSLFITEGEWKIFSNTDRYKRWREENYPSYFWDELIQKTCINAIDGAITGNADLFQGENAIREMAKEPRLFRRIISKLILQAVEKFPNNKLDSQRHVTFIPSHFKGVGYVFLQVHSPDIQDYEGVYRPMRSAMLEVACGSAKNKFSDLNKVIGIAMEAPKHAEIISEDFALLNCHDWSDEDAERYREGNKEVNFFQTDAFRGYRVEEKEFPS